MMLTDEKVKGLVTVAKQCQTVHSFSLLLPRLTATDYAGQVLWTSERRRALRVCDGFPRSWEFLYMVTKYGGRNVLSDSKPIDRIQPSTLSLGMMVFQAYIDS